MTSFDKLGLNSNLIKGLYKEGIKNPTAIQEKAIPLSLENKDIIGQSETGSGKTLAYLLPMFQKIDSSKREMQAIILAPTHELVMQIDKQIKSLSLNSEISITSAPIIGEANIKRQIEKLKEKPHIIVGSSGRILKLIKDRKISAHTVKTIVIDEGDKLLDEKNLGTVKDIIKTTMKDRQLMLFSATINERTLDISKNLMKDPEIIKIESKELVNPNINHMSFLSEQRDKIEVLRKLIAAIKPERAIIFINRSEEIDITTSKLKYHNLKVDAIYGSAVKEERQRALEGFRSGKIQLLVASDLAARGLDIKDVTHIFNLDLPEDPKEYLHRVGRTGRAGKEGTAISIVSERELPLIDKYKRTFNIEIETKDVYKGAIVDFGNGRPSNKRSFRKKQVSKDQTRKPR
ncbi:DEAD/DEAH box helicase [Clostridium bovifaecis]|uniref:DEAD/DEAH box helicase n=1 Tax=Clostridium bovifaecis TaxID=2184719 RepID=A0A6I6F0E8_9CLOT|nr:DEAD/DEAH box helicase [Clostridium bovifaecis]